MEKMSDELPRGHEPHPTDRRWHSLGAASSSSSATTPANYALLEAVFLLGLVGVIALSRRRERDCSPAIPQRDLPVMALATFALADTLAKEKISTWLREPFVVEDGQHKPVAPEGHGLRHAIGELLTCTRCVGTWSALALVGLRTASPSAGRAVANVLALAGGNDLMQTCFRMLSERTNLASLATDRARKEAS